MLVVAGQLRGVAGVTGTVGDGGILLLVTPGVTYTGSSWSA